MHTIYGHWLRRDLANGTAILLCLLSPQYSYIAYLTPMQKRHLPTKCAKIAFTTLMMCQSVLMMAQRADLALHGRIRTP